MNVFKLKPDTEYNASVPSIATIKEHIAIEVLELNEHAARGRLNSYELARARVNRKVDEYIKMRTLQLIK